MRSFRYAYEGLQYSLSTQRNMKFHFLVSFIVLVSALVFHLSRIEILFLMLSITLVILSELINTAIEKTVDLAMPKHHPVAKIAKDVAAASVLIAAIFAVSVAMVVFFAPLDRLIRQLHRQANPVTAEAVWIFIVLVLMAVIVVQTRFTQTGGVRAIRPSIVAALAFSVSTSIAMLVQSTLAVLMAYALSALIVVILYDKTERTMRSLVLSSLAGVLITLSAFYLYHRG